MDIQTISIQNYILIFSNEKFEIGVRRQMKTLNVFSYLEGTKLAFSTK